MMWTEHSLYILQFTAVQLECSVYQTKLILLDRL